MVAVGHAVIAAAPVPAIAAAFHHMAVEAAARITINALADQTADGGTGNGGCDTTIAIPGLVADHAADHGTDHGTFIQAAVAVIAAAAAAVIAAVVAQPLHMHDTGGIKVAITITIVITIIVAIVIARVIAIIVAVVVACVLAVVVVTIACGGKCRSAQQQGSGQRTEGKDFHHGLLARNCAP